MTRTTLREAKPAERKNVRNTMSEKYQTFKIDDFPELKMKDYKEGVGIFYLDSWEQYYKYLLTVMNQNEDNKSIMKHYRWRGERYDNKKLLSSFDSWYREKVADRNENHRKELLEKHLEVFSEKLEKATGKQFNRDEDDKCWALAQHYGLSTPLLDWTKDPNKAAYFTFFEKADEEQTLYRAIYGLNEKIKIILHDEGIDPKERFIKIIEDIVNMDDKIENKRLKKQEGLFTEALNGDDIETNIIRLLSIRPDITDDQKIILFKILIPDKERSKALEWLEVEKEIHNTELFPDIEGAVVACKMELGLI